MVRKSMSGDMTTTVLELRKKFLRFLEGFFRLPQNSRYGPKLHNALAYLIQLLLNE